MQGLSELDRLRLENKREWTMSHLLNLIIEKELRDKITSLTKRVYKLEKAVEPGEGSLKLLMVLPFKKCRQVIIVDNNTNMTMRSIQETR